MYRLPNRKSARNDNISERSRNLCKNRTDQPFFSLTEIHSTQG